MKLLVFILVLTVCFISATLGLHCYQCADETTNLVSSSYDCDKPHIKSCSSEEDYCLKTVMRSKWFYGEEKRCASSSEGELCKLSSTFPSSLIGAGPEGTVHCCQGDLCNSSSKLSNQNVLFYAIIFELFF